MSNLKGVKRYDPSVQVLHSPSVKRPDNSQASGTEKVGRGEAVVVDDKLKKESTIKADEKPASEIKGDVDLGLCVPIGSRLLITGEDETSYQFIIVNVTDQNEHFLIPTVVSETLDLRGADTLNKGVNECTEINNEKDNMAKNDGAIAVGIDPNKNDRFNVGVNEYSTYVVSKETLAHYPFKTAGLRFGAITVPFKFRLGGDKRIVNSPMVAPYVAYRTGWGYSLGVNFTPLLSAGLTTIKVPDGDGKERDVAAFSAGAGFRISSTVDEKFGLGLLLGKDFVNDKDKESDPNLAKNWLSLYVSYDF